MTTEKAIGEGQGGAAVTTAGAAGLAQMDPIGSRAVCEAGAGAGLLPAELTNSGGGALTAGIPSQSAEVHLRALAAPAFVIAGAAEQDAGRLAARKRGSHAPRRGLQSRDCCGRLCMYLLTAAAADLRWDSQAMLNFGFLEFSDSGDDDDDPSTTLSIPSLSPAVVMASLILPGQWSIL